MNWRIDPKAQPSTSQSEATASAVPEQEREADERDFMPAEDSMWLRLAKDAYNSSTSFVESNMRKKWDDSLRAFNNLHAAESKYNNPAYDKRSKLFRPKIRTIVRKNEAAAAAAFFSNIDVVNVEAQDANNKFEAAGASVMKQLLQYRLTKSVKWFHTLLGGFQDAQSVGACVAHIHWEYIPPKPDLTIIIKPADTPEGGMDEEYPKQGDLPKGAQAIEGDTATIDIEVAAQPTQYGLGSMQPPQPEQQQPGMPPTGTQQAQQPKKPKPISDKPLIELVPIENVRFDAAANWDDPIHSSPFLIVMMPMYMMDIRAKMDDGDWISYGDGFIKSISDTRYDSTRTARQQTTDIYDTDGKILSDYEICWVQRHIHRRDNEDWEFYTLNNDVLLCKPYKLTKTVLHGRRPYEMGTCLIEPHKPYASSLYSIAKDLQTEANEIANQRIDNVKFVLNKKFLVKRGKNVDTAGLVRNVPGGVVMADNPEEDIKELTWPDVTASSYEEQQRIDNDMSDLLGNFSAAQVMADHGINGPARNMAILGQNAGTLVEYTLRTFVETFVQPVLRQLVLLEQHYETDEVVLALAGKKAQVFKKFGVDAVTDELLEQELTLNVNVGMGATDPQLRTQKFMAAMSSYAMVAKEQNTGLNMEEVGKELFGNLGYADGSRFFTNDNPQVAQLTAELQQAKQMIMQLSQQVKEKMTGHQVKLQTTQMVEGNKARIAQNKEENANLRSAMIHKVALVEGDKQRTHDVIMKNMERRMSMINHVHEPRAMRSQ